MKGHRFSNDISFDGIKFRSIGSFLKIPVISDNIGQRSLVDAGSSLVVEHRL